MFLRILAMILLSTSPALAQHSGHEQAPPQPSQSRQAEDGTVLAVHDAIKASQALFRDLGKAAQSGDEPRFVEMTSRYEASIDDLVRSVDAVQGSRSYAKDLDVAQRSLSRQLQQIQQMAATAAPSAEEWYARLTDAVILGRDNILAQQESIRAEPASGGGDRHGGMSHGCGSSHSRG